MRIFGTNVCATIYSCLRYPNKSTTHLIDCDTAKVIGYFSPEELKKYKETIQENNFL
jgi:hypothetical protein